MKTIAICWSLLLLSLVPALAQSRFSIAPTYWFNHDNYTYQVLLLSDPRMSVSDFSGYSNGSSVGLTSHYYFSEKWSFSVGILYNKSTSHVNSPQIGDVSLQSEHIQLPASVNYRLSTRRLSPYFSAGFFLEKNRSLTNDPFKTNAVVGAGLDYRVNSKFSLLVQPTGSYLLYKPSNSSLIVYNSFNSYKLGVQVQTVWHF